MTQAELKFASFEACMAWSNDPQNSLEGQFELIDGELVELTPESGLNDAIANRLFFRLVSSGIAPLDLVRPGKCEIQIPVLVPVLKHGDAANRFPDLVVLSLEHLALTQTRLLRVILS
jgi:Uma2 family endonuclease